MGVEELFGLARGAAAEPWALTLLAASAALLVVALSAALGRKRK